MSQVFISYRRGYTSAYARGIYERLSERFGSDRVFMDIDTMEPGVDFVDYIDRALASASVMIALIGPDWLTSKDQRDRRRLDDPEDFVRIEVAAALDRADVRVIPVLVGGTTMPGTDDLPEPLARLRRRNALEVSDTRWQYDVGLLIGAVEKGLGTSARFAEQTTTHESSLAVTQPAPAPPPNRNSTHVPPPGESVGSTYPGRHRLSGVPLALVAMLLLAVGVGAGVMFVTLGGSGDETESVGDRSAAGDGREPNTRREGEAPASEEDSVSAKSRSAGADVSYESYSPPSGGYEALVPSGADWVVTPESEPSPGIRRTIVEGPRGTELWIDYTPGERAQFAADDKQVERHLEVTHPTLGTADVWTFTGGVPLCQTSTCVDYLMNDGQQGFGVLAGGPDSTIARDVARRVAMSISPD